ncbi:MAG: DUF2007 domain-containing protein [Flavobacteriaceae bacterium]|nr:DUF2007 domain-containing protein [Flavobacteriaceae bacterium]MDG2386691.1 DUF2007 domain-containing protein [Flavobacteriaceae bacterium]
MSRTYKKLFHGTAIDVAKLCSVLDTLGIIPVVKDQAESARLAGFGTLFTDQEIWVHLDEYERAREAAIELGL